MAAKKKIAKKAIKTAAKTMGDGNPKKSKKQKRNMALRIIPYVMCVLALIIGVCLILINFDGGVGEVGYWFGQLLCAVIGPAAFVLPVVMGYVGVKWILYNIKWDEKAMNPSGERYADYKRAKRRLVLQAVMSVLTLVMIAAFAGVIADQRYFEPIQMGNDAIDALINGDMLMGGGTVGGIIACGLLLAFDTVISYIILVILSLLFVLLALGLTPDYIIIKITEIQAARAEQRAEEKEIREKQKEEERKARAAAAPTPVPPKQEPIAEEKQPNRQMSVDEMLSDTPITETTATAKKGKTVENKKTAPLDFGGDPTFDKGEFDNIDSIIKGFDTPIAPAKEPVIEEKPKEEPKPEPLNIDMTRITSDDLLEDVAAVAPDDEGEDVPEISAPYIFPSIDMLAKNKNTDTADHTEELQNNAKVLVETLRSFRVGVKEVTYSRGPTITRYELKPEVGTRVRSIANLVDDIALNLATSGVRIEAPIPGKAAVGIEVPNQTRATVYLRDLIDNPKFTESKSKLTAALGADVGGNPIHFDIGKMPHLLIAGTTGSGKSICINCVIVSILYKAKPDEVKLILIDPKKVEFNMYKNIPHLYCPIVSDPKKAAGALASAVAEMERRFELIEQVGVRDIAGYNAVAETDPDLEFMPHMVIIIDELADLMMTARDEVETNICRIAQKARAAGIHMILGTQRPSVDVITGLIKANVPSRIACTVMSQVDSRTIIDVAGAESLIGRGDMLFAPVGASKPLRVQGAFVHENEIERIVSFIKENNGEARYNTEFVNRIEVEAAKCGMGKKGAAAQDADMPSVEGGDTKFSEAVKLAIETGKISTSLMQRRLGVGYGRAAKIIDTMEEMGYVSAPDGNKPRQVLITMDEYMRRMVDGNLGGADV